MAKQVKQRSKEYYRRWADGLYRRRRYNVIINKIWSKVWWIPVVSIITPALFISSMLMYKDYTLSSFHANIEAPYTDIFSTWRTDGSPGQEPNN